MNDIERLQRTYGYFPDKARWAPLSELFAEDATLEIGGKGRIELERSVGVALRRTGTIEALLGNPQLLRRAGRLATFALLAGAAGWVIIGYTSDSFASVQEAVAAMK